MAKRIPRSLLIGKPLATLRANWSKSYPGSQRVSAQVAQACEYGQLMGQEALRRQWSARGGASGDSRYKTVCSLLGWEHRHLRSVA